MKQQRVVIHGGAGLKDESVALLQLPIMAQARDSAWSLLEAGAPAEEAVVAALQVLEECQYFNAGFGGYPNKNGIVLLDVGLMRGNREFLSLMNVRKLKYPSRIALDLLNQGLRSMLIWTHELMQSIDNADEEKKTRYGWVTTHDELLAPYVREILAKRQKAELEKRDGHGTVGCVVQDAAGNFAAGTSTGGISLKSNGRIGDSPIIGAGVYADNELGALSTSGHGESVLLSLVSGFLLGEIRRTLSNDPLFFQKNSNAALELLERELDEFSRKAPGRCAGVILIPKGGPVTCDVRNGGFTVASREYLPTGGLKEELRVLGPQRTTLVTL